METHFRPGDIYREPRSMRVDRRAISSSDTLILEIGDMFGLERSYLSLGESNHKASDRVTSPSPIPSRNHSIQQTKKVIAADSDELVKHMSNLPSYLEQEVKPQKKAFNVGVLDWNLLEQWQSNKNVPFRSGGSSLSNSNSSSPFLTEESSTHSQTGPSSSVAHHFQPRRSKSMSAEKATHLRPLDDCSVVSKSKDSKLATGQRSSEEKQKNSTERSSKVHYSELSCYIPVSCPQSNDVNDQKIRVMRPIRFLEAKTSDNTSAAGSQLDLDGELIGQVKERISKDNQPILMGALPTVSDLHQGSRIPSRTVDATKSRYASPTGQFISCMGTGSRKTSSIENAEAPRACRRREVLSTPVEKSSVDKSISASRARESPLKRLLDPIRKPREANNSHSSESLMKDLKPVGRTAAPGIRAGLNSSSEKSTSIQKPHQKGKNNEPPVVEALLQMVVQNGCPLFTFAADNVKDILCAALGKVSSKFEDRYLYTFFSIQELKNKSWINLRGKGSSHEYSPNVVAQMEVCETQLLEDHRFTGNDILKQFVLSTVDQKSGEKTGSEYQLSDEIAAIVVCVPVETRETDKSKFNGTTVILPSGIHTLPFDGKPSPLFDRWRSGGRCDCGGWDSGCELRILTDSKCQSNSSLKFELFDQVGADEKQPAFNLAPFKDKEGVLSVSFSSSISPLQAFSICLAVLDSRNHSRPTPTPPAHAQEAKTSDEAAGRFVSVPPHSRVGRV
uniref:Uncharacterized protein n=1 Tax=Kalanchoe fedtschenkoi TaxID=63787 RepID=A0A7N0TFZ7_KALFE